MNSTNPTSGDRFRNAMGHMFRSHPWHGVSIGDRCPEIITTYVEMTPTDTVKYELDKATGILTVDRPQLYSSVCPALYGFVPRTYCAEKVAELCMIRNAVTGIVGDGDPLDVCILTEKYISHGNILMQAVPIGGLRMVDGNEADDKIIAVLFGDAAYKDWRSIEDCPASLLVRLRHYFLTYKQSPDSSHRECDITHIYGREEAHEVIRRSQMDYSAHYSDIEGPFRRALQDSSET
jgi:inorganic pyrophosphatase